MLSRTASSLYWLGRYFERADFTARLVEATARLDTLSSRPAGEAAWHSALAVTDNEDAFAATADARARLRSPASSRSMRTSRARSSIASKWRG